MINTIKRHKIVIVFVLVDLFLFWMLFYSGIVLPFINPSIEEYRKSFTSFPRNANQIFLWIIIHMPSSIIIGKILEGIKGSDIFLSLSIIQTGLITYFIEKYIRRK
jgi:hypothetical protein